MRADDLSRSAMALRSEVGCGDHVASFDTLWMRKFEHGIC